MASNVVDWKWLCKMKIEMDLIAKVNKMLFSIVTLCGNSALWLAVPSRMTSFNQLKVLSIRLKSVYSTELQRNHNILLLNGELVKLNLNNCNWKVIGAGIVVEMPIEGLIEKRID